jgi:hypothetical protein
MRVSFELDSRIALFLVGVVAAVSAVGIVMGYGGTDPSFAGHTPGEIGPGTFGSGDFTFPKNLTIDDSLNLGENVTVGGSACINGVCKASWPALTCTIKTEAASGDINCDAGWTMTGGGCRWRSDGNDAYVESYPITNGWHCIDYDGPVSNKYVRCCKIE